MSSHSDLKQLLIFDSHYKFISMRHFLNPYQMRVRFMYPKNGAKKAWENHWHISCLPVLITAYCYAVSLMSITIACGQMIDM